MGQKQDIIKVARSQLGTKEMPAGSNRVKYTAWYPMIGPWCAMFTSWCAEQAGIPQSIIPKHAYTPSGKNWFKARGQWGTKAVVGAFSYYNLSGLGRVSHTGIVIKVYSDGSFDAIEGNTDAAGGRTGGKVMIKRRKAMGAGGGFGYPKYNGKSTKPKGASTGGTVYENAKQSKTLGSRVIRLYSGGTDVLELQKLLKGRGFNVGTIDGSCGPTTVKAIKAFQSANGLVSDGEAGEKTIAKLTGKKATPAPKAPAKKPAATKPKAKPKANLVVDGAMGKQTKLALQRALGVTADGIVGAGTIKALQRKVGAAVDGKWGKDTTKKLQKKLGVKQDGAIGPLTIKALQRALNSGSF